MKEYKNKQFDLRLCDNMELMAQYPDNYFDLAVVDPPYGIGENGSTNNTRGKLARAKKYKSFAGGDKSSPEEKYFIELKRVSKNVIIWGANHFIEKIPKANSSCWIVWDKVNGKTDFADSELAYSSFKTAVRNFRFQWQGMLQGDMKNKETRIHPTQKPIALYKWIFTNYAKQGYKILDTHLGSMSIAVAVDSLNKVEKMDLHLTGCEIDQEYFDKGIERLKRAEAQLSLF